MKPVLAALVVVATVVATSSAAIPQRPAKAVIRGVVLLKGTDEPIPDAWVILTKFGAKESMYAGYLSIPITPSAITDRDGRFEIRDIDPESYELTIRRTGYARQVYGQRVENGNVPPIELSAGEHKDLAIHLTPTGSVSGFIRNTSGRPIAGIGVDLIRRTYTSTGNRSFATVAQTKTNDRGEYRFYWITPGGYYIRAGDGRSRVPPIESFDEGVRNGNNLVRREYGESYYPGVRDFDKSIAIEVDPQSELRGTDFTVELRRQPFRVRVHVIDSLTGQPPIDGVVWVMTSPGNGYGELDVTLDRELGPGAYWIGFVDRPGASSATPAAFAKIVVVDSDVDLTLMLTMPPVVNGRVSVDGELPASTKLDDLSFRAQPTGAEGIFFTTARVGADGTFMLHGIPNSESRVEPLDLPAGLYLKEARIDGVDVFNSPAYFPNGSRLDLVISSKGGQIEGTVVDDRTDSMSNVQAVLVPNLRRDRRELFKSVNTNSAGRFSMTGIAPGDYKLFAWEALEPYAWFDPEVLGVFESMGKPIHVSESSTQTVQLRMIPEAGTP